MSYLTLNNLTFRYNGEKVLDNFSLSVGKGEHVAIKGESGTGKTTLFRLLLGFEQPESGEIRFVGELLSKINVSVMRRNSSWIPQDLNIGDGTVKEVLNRPFEFRVNKDQKPDPKLIEDVLISLGLNSTIMEQPFRDLSTGQRQRVALALCHLLNRPLLLLDEPTSALDESSKQKAIDLLFSNPDRTILSTSHDPYWLERCDRVYELD